MIDSTTQDFSSPLRDFKSGDVMNCRIGEKQAGGYSLILPDNDIRESFLPTSVQLTEGDDIEVFFVCSDGKRLFLSMTEEEFRRRMQLRAERMGR